MDIKDYEPNIKAATNEINTWRKYFLGELFAGSCKFIPEEDKICLTSYFLSIPSESFGEPWNEFHKCVALLLQRKEQER